MVSRCANPNCDRSFRSLKQGKLIVVPPLRNRLPERFSPNDLAWLCDECSLSFTVARTPDGHMRVIGRHGASAVAA